MSCDQILLATCDDFYTRTTISVDAARLGRQLHVDNAISVQQFDHCHRQLKIVLGTFVQFTMSTYLRPKESGCVATCLHVSLATTLCRMLFTI